MPVARRRRWFFPLLLDFALDLFAGLSGGGSRPRLAEAFPIRNVLKAMLAYSFQPRLSALFWWPFFIWAVIKNLRATAPPRPMLYPERPDFPPHLEVYAAPVRNFDADWASATLWHVVPWDDDELLEVVRWAVERKWQLRPLGSNHSWSPLGAGPDAGYRTLVIDLRRFREIGPVDLAGDVVGCGAAATLEEVSAFLGERDRALPWSIAAGEVSVGGALAVGGHGTGTDRGPVDDPEGPRDEACTMSALAQWVDAVVHDGAGYVVKRFERGDADFPVLALALGGTLILRAGLRTVADYDLYHDVDAFHCKTYFAGQLAKDLERGLRLELMWLPHQGILRGKSRLRLIRRYWERRLPAAAPDKETEPYRDALVNFATHHTDVAVRKAFHDARPAHTDPISVGYRMQYVLWASSLADPKLCTAHAGNLYASHFILHYHSAGWCVIVQRDQVGVAMQAIADQLQSLQDLMFRPVNGPVEVRFTPVDPKDGPLLSPARCPEGREPKDLYAVWVSALSDLKDTRAGELFHNFEAWLFNQIYAGDIGVLVVRPEWPKGAAYTPDGRPWAHPDALRRYRKTYGAAMETVETTLRGFDPEKLFVSTLGRRVFE